MIDWLDSVLRRIAIFQTLNGGDYFEVSLADLTSLLLIEIQWNGLLRPIRRMVYNVNILILFKNDILLRFIHSKI